MGWERKRGKLEDLNRFLNGEPPRNDIQIVNYGDPERLMSVRFVITLDKDTQLPSGTARRLVETMAHPLNAPVVDQEKGIVTRGYTIIQPRVSTSLPSATATTFSRCFTDPVGSDPYTTAVSDVYQDLAGEGSYHGKGIYDPRAFHQVLTGRFPPARLLSHDLIEGGYVRVGLASDIELFDEFPGDYSSYSIREHRWLCGDWQIARWIFPTVPPGESGFRRNPLTLLNRWKIFDNLRRSLVLPASIAFLGVAWASSWVFSAAAGLLVVLVQYSAPLTPLVTWMTSKRAVRRTALATFGRDMQRAGAETVLMMHRAGVAFDAIVRVSWRLMVTRKGLLKWTTSQAAGSRSQGPKRSLTIQIIIGSGVSVLLGALSAAAGPLNFVMSAPFILAWLGAPVLFWFLARSRKIDGMPLGKTDELQLREIARSTWRTFEEFVGFGTNWLPSDNYQLSHVDELAPRTSPTNIGLYMLSTLGASDFGYLPGEEAVRRIGETVYTLESLEKYEGHLLNWYDLITLEPLTPRYVSTVDSGNFLASLWTLEQGIRDLGDEPILGPVAFRGRADTVRFLLKAMERAKLGGEQRRDASNGESEAGR
jgi:cyclic beta-1,2-glucan synthetase